MTQQSIAALPRTDLSGARTCITSPYGPRGGGVHYGTDQGSVDGIEIGTPVHARLDGKVVAYQYDGPFRPPNGHTAGHNIWFMADNGRRFKFFHLNGPPVVPINQWVRQGTVIAHVGNSGTQAAHLHEEEHRDSWSNPINNTADIAACYDQGRFAGNTGPIPNPQPEDWFTMATKEELRDVVREEITAAFGNDKVTEPLRNHIYAALDQRHGATNAHTTKETERTRDELVQLLVDKGIIPS